MALGFLLVVGEMVNGFAESWVGLEASVFSSGPRA